MKAFLARKKINLSWHNYFVTAMGAMAQGLFASLLIGIGIGLIQPLTGIVTSAYSRRAEYRADRQAVKEGYGPAMITGLKKLARENFAHLAPARALVILQYSHPPMSERIAAIEAEMRKKSE